MRFALVDPYLREKTDLRVDPMQRLGLVHEDGIVGEIFFIVVRESVVREEARECLSSGCREGPLRSGRRRLVVAGEDGVE